MAYRTVALSQEDYPWRQQGLQHASDGYRVREEWQQTPDGYNVYVTKTEWMPTTVDAPRYPILPDLFNNKVHEEYGIRYEEPADRVHLKKPEERVPVDAERVHVKKHVHYEKTNGHNRKVVQEDVNMEANEFIKRKHKAFEMSKLMSMKGYQG